MPARENQSRLTVMLDNVNLGVWDNKTGGDQDSNSTQYFLGGMGPRISLGGTVQVSNVVLQALQMNSPQPNGAQIEANKKFILSRVGKGEVTVTEQPVDDEGDAFGQAEQWTGKLKRAKLADVNSQGNNAKLFEIEVEVDGAIS